MKFRLFMFSPFFACGALLTSFLSADKAAKEARQAMEILV
jgi:hypothetical protein